MKMDRFFKARRLSRHLACAVSLIGLLGASAPTATRPWMNGALTPDARAVLLQRQMTLDEEVALVHSQLGSRFQGITPSPDAIGSAAFVAANQRLGIPALQISDAGLGVAFAQNARPGDTATALPSGLATASSWDPELSRQAGAMIGQEAWRKGFNILLAGGADLVRDPRNGRNFEYAGEDPLLAGRIVGAEIAGIQSQHVLSTIKHYAMNDLETGRMTASAQIAPQAMRESDLLTFEIAIETGHPGAVMCGYNRVNDVYDCENDYLLSRVLKQDWRYPGFVMSDWGGTHSTVRAALAGLDQESAGEGFDARVFFGAMLRQAVVEGAVPRARLDDMTRRILRSMFAVGLFDTPPRRMPTDEAADAAIAGKDEANGIVLLRNAGDVLPLGRGVSAAVIGSHADAGVLSGGGSSQVMPVGGNAVPNGGPSGWPGPVIYDPSSPLKAMQALAPGTRIQYASGDDVAAAVELARHADVAVVFVHQWLGESFDAASLALPDRQDALVEAVAAANPRTIIVIESGGPVAMPWLGHVAGVLETWYPGSAGGTAIADVLYGVVDPSGHLPVTFPVSTDQLPRPTIPGAGKSDAFTLTSRIDQEIIYNEGADAGYRWFERQHAAPLFPFGFGLSYTHFGFEGLSLRGGATLHASFTVRNLGQRAGRAVAQMYTTRPGGTGRLIGWQSLVLQPGESRRVDIAADPRLLSRFDEKSGRWRQVAGPVAVAVGGSVLDAALQGNASLQAESLAP